MSYPSAINKFDLNSCQWGTTPSNWSFNHDFVVNLDATIPGGSITEEHWEQDKLFERKIEYYFQGMGRYGITDFSVDGFYTELNDAIKGHRRNSYYHLMRIFDKAYNDVYSASESGSSAKQDAAAAREQTISLLMQADGVIR